MPIIIIPSRLNRVYRLIGKLFDFVQTRIIIIRNIFNSSFVRFTRKDQKKKRSYLTERERERVRLIPRVVLTFKLFKSCQPLYYLRGMIHPGANSRICTTGITTWLSCIRTGGASAVWKNHVLNPVHVAFKSVVVIYLRLFVFHAKLQWFSSLFLSPC